MRQNKKVIASKRIAGLPLFAVPVAALERRVVARAFFGFVFPNRGTDAIDADFVGGFVGGSICRFIFAHIFTFLFGSDLPERFVFTKTQNKPTAKGANEARHD